MAPTCIHLSNSHFNRDFIIKSLEIVLKRNVFYFDGIHYIQKKGMAMGTKVAPTYATLVLGFLEETLYKRTGEKHRQEFSTFLRSSWKRFLDDCFIIWMIASSYGPRQANLVLIAYASSEGSGEPAHPRSLARTFAARS